jgi:F-type H+-transporting ATPase subunit b
MINFSILISSSEVSGPGGLFDLGATIPLVAIQFLLIMVILNIILYNPLLTIIEERQEYILTKLSQASEILAKANKLTTEYEQQLDNARKEAQLNITDLEEIYKGFLEYEVKVSQLEIDSLSKTFTNALIDSKEDIVRNNLKEITELLCDNVETRLSVLFMLS